MCFNAIVLPHIIQKKSISNISFLYPVNFVTDTARINVIFE